MVANDQDGIYVEGTTRARPASTEENLYMRNTRNKNTESQRNHKCKNYYHAR